MSEPRTSILFVCLGNICRSPLAEGVFLHKVRERGLASRFAVDSAGLGSWHVGSRPDPRSIDAAKRRGVELPGCARLVSEEDFQRQDLIVCMDESNRGRLLAMGAPADRVRMMLEFHPDTRLREVPDPYHGDRQEFDTVYDLVERACEGLIEHLVEHEPGRA